MPSWPFRRGPQEKVPLDALGRPFRSAVGPNPPSPGSSSDPGGRLDAERMAERKALAPDLDPEIFGDLDDLADAMATLDPGDCDRLLAFWRGIDPEVRATALEHAREIAESTGRLPLLRFVQDEMLGWARVRETGNRPHVERWFDPLANSAVHLPSWTEALPPLADAAAALALQDVLEDEDFDALFGPWLNAMGGGPDDPEDGAEATAGGPDATEGGLGDDRKAGGSDRGGDR